MEMRRIAKSLLLIPPRRVLPCDGAVRLTHGTSNTENFEQIIDQLILFFGTEQHHTL
jgi:hypothetical protein